MDIRQAVEEILLNGGLTIDPFTQYQPTEGFAVSIPGEEEVFDVNQFNESSIDGYIDRHLVKFAGPGGCYFGAWRNGDRVHLDVSLVFTDEDYARQVGRNYGQKAIYNLGTDETIYLEDPKEEHYRRLQELQRMFSAFQGAYLIENSLRYPIDRSRWPDLLAALIIHNNNTTEWATENL